MEVAKLHAPVSHVRAPAKQTVPQAPQLSASVLVSVQVPWQTTCPLGHPDEPPVELPPEPEAPPLVPLELATLVVEDPDDVPLREVEPPVVELVPALALDERLEVPLEPLEVLLRPVPIDEDALEGSDTEVPPALQVPAPQVNRSWLPAGLNGQAARMANRAIGRYRIGYFVSTTITALTRSAPPTPQRMSAVKPSYWAAWYEPSERL